MKKNNAFTMIELAIVVIIMALLLAGGFEGAKFFLLQNQIKATLTKMSAIQNALDIYVIQNGKLPCPAGLKTSNGIAATSCSGSNPTTGISYISSPPTATGGVPYETLNIPADLAYDAWKNKFTYKVAYAATTNIRKMNNTSTKIYLYNNIYSTSYQITNQVVYSIASHGPNKKGGYNANTNTQISTSGLSTNELYNTTGYSMNIYFSNKKKGDDLVRYKTAMQLLTDTNIEDVSCYIISSTITTLASNNSISPTPTFSIPSGNYLDYNNEIKSTSSPKYKIKCFKYGRLGIYRDDE